jgi:GTP-binding protein EngB required for normal cell division
LQPTILYYTIMASPDKKTASKYEIVFVGRSNVGKSTLIKSITGKPVPIGRRPGVTRRPWNLALGDLIVTDMPGFGFMSGVKDRKQDIIKTKFVRYIEDHSDRIILAVLVLNGKSFAEIVDRWSGRGEIPLEVEMYQFLLELELDVVVAVNKIDKIKDNNRDSVMDGVAERLDILPPWKQWPDKLVPISAKKGDVKALSGLIRSRIHELGRDDLLGYIR